MKDDATVAPPVMEFRDQTAFAAAATATAPASESAEAAAVAEEPSFVMLSFVFSMCSGSVERISPTLPVFLFSQISHALIILLASNSDGSGE